MTIQNETVDVASTHGQLTAGFIIKMIRESEVDEYLKAIFDAVKEHKLELELSKGLPAQKLIPQESIDDSKVEAIAIAISAPPITQNKIRAVSGTGTTRHYAHKPRPPADIKIFSGYISPIKGAPGSSVDPNTVFGHDGYIYKKKDVIGECFAGNFEGVILKYQVIGVGPKAVKILLVDEPPSHIIHNKKSLYTAWQNNEPIFIGHSALALWLVKN